MISLFRRATCVSVVLLTLSRVALALPPEEIWQRVDKIPQDRPASQAWIHPQKFHAFKINHGQLRALLNRVGKESSHERKKPTSEILLPMPDGTLARFSIIESPVMAPELAAEFPEIKTFRGIGVDDPRATVRLDITPQGFHAQILSPNGAVYIDPYWRGDNVLHTSYYKRNYRRAIDDWTCLTRGGDSFGTQALAATADLGTASSGGTLRIYRLAVAATGEYTTYQGGTVALGQAAIVTAVNRVTGVYEIDMAIRLVLVANNSSLVYTNSATDPYTNNNSSSLLSQNQSNIDSVIGTSNYDIGHVFSTAGGGLAALGVVCKVASKAQGETGTSAPTGDAYWIDYVAHEMGHQFGGNHTFNSTTSSCGGGNRNASTAYEAGSGSTIMAYAGICGADDLQAHSDPYFHSISYEEIMAYVTTGSGTCSSNVVTGNTAPTVSAGPNYTIPASTSFILTATGSDPDGDALTYCWEERDLGVATTLAAADNGSSPLFRSFNPATSPSRIFPRIQDLIGNTNSLGEKLPTTSRTMKFRVTARDNRANGGGSNSSATNGITIVSTAGPFVVTFPNTATNLAGNVTVTWNIANTTNLAINAANVNILLSTNGGLSFTTMLSSNTPNDGTETVALPSLTTSAARIKVEATGNIFFDISNVNFSIAPSGVSFNVSVSKTGLGGGTVTSSPAGISCGGSCSASFVSNTVVNLTATPDANSSFTGWSGAATGTASPVAVTVNGNKSVSAAFNAKPVVSGAQVLPGAVAYSDEPLGVTGVIAGDAEGDAISYAYQWQSTTDGTTYNDAAGATTTSLPAAAGNSGKLWRLRITPSDAFGTGAAFFTSTISVNNRPNLLGRTGQFYSYDSDLFVVNSGGSTFTRSALINEFSQGTSAAKEWVEILFLKDSDARGWKLFDSNSGTVTFSSASLWTNVPAGTLLVVYNGGDKDTTLPASDDVDASDGTLVIAHSSATYFTGNWIGLSNGGDSIALSDSASSLIDGISYGNTSTQTPTLGSVSAGAAASYTGDTEAGVDNAGNWQVTTAASATPAAGNGTTNSDFVANIRSGAFNSAPLFRFGAAGDSVTGLSIDPASGIASGILNVPGGGFFNVIIERTSGLNLASQQYNLLVGDTNDVYTIPTGKTWTLNTNYTVAGSLVVQGTLNTAGWTLTVSNALDVSSGTVSNTGFIYYGTLSGGPLPGNSQQLASTDSDGDGLPDAWEISFFGNLAQSDTDDFDGDGFSNMQEYMSGTDPKDSASALQIVSVTPSGNDNLIGFASVADKTYQVKYSDDLATGIWILIQQVTATGSTTQVSDTGGALQPRRFYRVELVP